MTRLAHSGQSNRTRECPLSGSGHRTELSPCPLRPKADVPVILTPVAPSALGSFYFRRRRSDTPYNPNHPYATIFIAHERRTKERFLPSIGGVPCVRINRFMR